MKNYNLQFTIYALAVFFCLTLFFPELANAQSRDYLTNEEIELVRDAQEIDKRIDVLIKAIDRRFIVLNKDNSQAKQIEKDSDKWGELPTGTEIELISDINKILQKAVDDIDDLAYKQELNDKVLSEGESIDDRDEEVTKYNIKQNKKQFPIAVHNLADASRRYIPLFEAIGEKTTDKRIKGLVYGAYENCNLIIEASEKVPRYEKKDKKKKDKN